MEVTVAPTLVISGHKFRASATFLSSGIPFTCKKKKKNTILTLKTPGTNVQVLMCRWSCSAKEMSWDNFINENNKSVLIISDEQLAAPTSSLRNVDMT